MKSNLTVFANFYIDNAERFMRMKHSLQSMKTIKVDRYVINVRGRFANQAIDYIKVNVNVNVESLSLFSIESSNGWFYDTSRLLHLVKTPYILNWIEDHICMTPHAINPVVDEMLDCNADILTYSFWCDGKFTDRYAGIVQKHGHLIDWFDHTFENNYLVQKNRRTYLVSYASIINKKLFNKIICDDVSVRRWSKETPFDFEKAPEDVLWLPLRRANPKIELFASIDDDLSVAGTCLQSRGLYPVRVARQSYALGETKYISRAYEGIKKIIRPFRFFVKFSSNVYRTPRNYRKDYILSILFPKDNSQRHLPWINYNAINYIDKSITTPIRIFEYGSGSSTLYWQEKHCHVVSIDHDKKFYDNLRGDINAKLVDYRLIEPVPLLQNSESVTDKTYESSVFKGYSFETYVNSINEYQDEYFDLVVIDGRSRHTCIQSCITKIRNGGILLLDNSNRIRYREACNKLLSNWKCISFSGTVRGLMHTEHTAIFIKPMDTLKNPDIV